MPCRFLRVSSSGHPSTTSRTDIRRLIAIFKYCYFILYSYNISFQTICENIAPKKTKEEKLEGKAARATDKAAASSRGLPSTERKRDSKKTTEVAERQDTWRILSYSLDFRSLRRMAVHSTLNSATPHQSHKSTTDTLRVHHERRRWNQVLTGKFQRKSYCYPYHGSRMPWANQPY